MLKNVMMLCRRLCRLRNHFTKVVIVVVIFLLLGEFAIYPIVLLKCSWPLITFAPGISEENETLRAMFVADTHLLGPFRGHWFDKLRREWQMHRSFQTAMSLFDPEVVFFLGDLFDEGNWVREKGFEDYVKRFKSLFPIEEGGKTRSFVVSGNHDMGFHYEITQLRNNRFNKAFKSESVQLLKLKGSQFLLLNSMAMKMDGCFLCAAAVSALNNVSETLKCEEDPSTCAKKLQRDAQQNKKYSPPILLQHFPMYRPSDAECSGDDAAPVKEKNVPFKESYDCLSKESSQFLFQAIKPRLIMSGHTHHHCVRKHTFEANPSQLSQSVWEYSVPSFNWRNRNDPSFYLAIITPSDYHLSKCYLPEESTVMTLYTFGGFILCLWLVSFYLSGVLARLSFFRRMLSWPWRSQSKRRLSI